jgi:hypothetical protein
VGLGRKNIGALDDIQFGGWVVTGYLVQDVLNASQSSISSKQYFVFPLKIPRGKRQGIRSHVQSGLEALDGSTGCFAYIKMISPTKNMQAGLKKKTD